MNHHITATQPNSSNVTLKLPEKPKDSALDVEPMSIDKSLFAHFPPELAVREQMFPFARVVVKGEGGPRPNQEWILKIAVEKSRASEVEAHADFYAEQLQNASRSFWPRRLTIQVVPTSQEEVNKRLPQLKSAWDMRLLEEGLVMPPPSPALPPPPQFTELQLAEQQLMASFGEATQTMIIDSPAPGHKSDQIIDLREFDKASNRRALQHVLNVAIMKRASDIHVEYLSDGMESPSVGFRLRIDGVLRPMIETAHSLGPALLNILGKCAGVGVEEDSFHMRPQDGKMIIYSTDGRRFDGRLAFVPVPVMSKSFNCVIRLLDSTQAFKLDDLDLSEANREILDWALGIDHGMVVLTGPTGSGKSSTIQACLRKLISPEVKVVSIEDPVEYYLKGAEQTQVNAKEPEMSFPALLRSALRRDPDVIFVGEIRDAETAHVAIQAALTGHLVLTTIHANSALEVIDRLVNLGVHRDLVASALSVVGAQRLVRRINPERWEWGETTWGKIESTLGVAFASTDADKERKLKVQLLKEEYDVGEYDNYLGRVAVHQFQRFDDQLKDAIRGGSSGRELYTLARRKGLRTLVEDAMVKVKRGNTSLEEVALTLRGT